MAGGVARRALLAMVGVISAHPSRRLDETAALLTGGRDLMTMADAELAERAEVLDAQYRRNIPTREIARTPFFRFNPPQVPGGLVVPEIMDIQTA